MWKNSLCVDPECTEANRCCHMGPRGELCDFTRERALCSLLGLEWNPTHRFTELVAQLHQRLALANTEVEMLTTSIAQRMVPAKPRHPMEDLASLNPKDPE